MNFVNNMKTKKKTVLLADKSRNDSPIKLKAITKTERERLRIPSYQYILP